ncbi:hypothetical protein [Paenarthrobacter histidinolovorans]|uniref:Uncharacterized protein n=1 Tax=Paenarthrobacter histidinolovorans TaxID=43664 RepID=A0ABW8NB84_9MICC|nr:hypothetical protein [Paenarthrobacter histidinolovorans]GGJ33816.1 hypothetical protein GCM10010052_33490 [Paenarthrobacter histidinolovorans]
MPQNEEPIPLLRDGQEEVVRAIRESESTLRLAKEDAERHPLIQMAIKQGETLNNVWLIQQGQELVARVRVKKKETGRFFITATVTLGVVVVAATTIRHRKNSD